MTSIRAVQTSVRNRPWRPRRRRAPIDRLKARPGRCVAGTGVGSIDTIVSRYIEKIRSLHWSVLRACSSSHPCRHGEIFSRYRQPPSPIVVDAPATILGGHCARAAMSSASLRWRSGVYFIAPGRRCLRSPGQVACRRPPAATPADPMLSSCRSWIRTEFELRPTP